MISCDNLFLFWVLLKWNLMINGSCFLRCSRQSPAVFSATLPRRWQDRTHQGHAEDDGQDHDWSYGMTFLDRKSYKFKSLKKKLYYYVLKLSLNSEDHDWSEDQDHDWSEDQDHDSSYGMNFLFIYLNFISAHSHIIFFVFNDLNL